MNNQVSEKENRGRWRALGLLSVVLVLSISTWFSAAAVLPQLRELSDLNPTTSAWLTIAVQVALEQSSKGATNAVGLRRLKPA